MEDTDRLGKRHNLVVGRSDVGLKGAEDRGPLQLSRATCAGLGYAPDVLAIDEFGANGAEPIEAAFQVGCRA